MLIGRRYCFHKATLSVRESDDRRCLQMIPVDSIVSVSSFSEDGRFVWVDWEGARLMLFREDFVERTALVEALPIPERFLVVATSTSIN